MTTEDEEARLKLERLNANIAKIEALSQRLIAALATKRSIPPNLQGPDQDLFLKAATAFWAESLTNPAKMIEHQAGYWGRMLKHYIAAQQALSSGNLVAPPDEMPEDPRFSNPLWQTHPYFNFIKQNYLTTAEAMMEAVADIDGLEERDRKRLKFFTQQLIDLAAPTNYLATNPDALERAVETDGQSLVDGMVNLVRDIEANRGDLLVSLSDPDAFTVGENIATTEGGVVYRNRLFELIQYTSRTETVHAVPLIIFPPWINKFYILDLREQNSLIRWIVDQGYTLFVVSWKNPDESYAGMGMDDYISEGFLTAIEEVKRITGEAKVNAIGYCIAGTTLALTLALLEKRGDKSVKSATFFTTLTDFSDQGEFVSFLDDSFVDAIERQVAESGILESFFMARTFSYLRANDLIYRPAIRSYMLGQAPRPFDLLFWNGDGTNLPGRMAVEYLRGLCQRNLFATDGFPVCGETVAIGEIKVPVCAVGCEADHIAAWRASYDGIRKFGSRTKSFILSQSGHVAGIVNPPGRKKYGHYTKDGLGEDSLSWREAAGFTEGSWWPTWEAWIGRRSGRRVPARNLGDSQHPVLAPAPGEYVLGK